MAFNRYFRLFTIDVVLMNRFLTANLSSFVYKKKKKNSYTNCVCVVCVFHTNNNKFANIMTSIRFLGFYNSVECIQFEHVQYYSQLKWFGNKQICDKIN